MYKKEDGLNKEGTNIISYACAWSSVIQHIKTPGSLQYVEFENPMIGTKNFGWKTISSEGYTGATSFVNKKSGYYLIKYIIEIKTGECERCFFALTHNNIEIYDSIMDLNTLENNEIYEVSKSILIYLKEGDILSILFTTDTNDIHIGYRCYLEENRWLVPVESTAFLIMTQLSE